MRNLLRWILQGSLGLGIAAATSASTAPYSVHEWGTFTSIQDSSGRAEPWNPFVHSDLPPFVHSRSVPTLNSAALCVHAGALRTLALKSDGAWLMRMETPVLYFHAAQSLSVDVEVRFPSGLLTEWYPQVSSFGPVTGVSGLLPDSDRSHLAWNQVRILDPASSAKFSQTLPRTPADSHYYAARNTTANVVEVSKPFADESSPSRDRFLFYRGAGNTPPPLGVARPADNRMLLINRSSTPLGPLHVVRRSGDLLSVHRLASLDPGASAPADLPAFSPTSVGEDGLESAKNSLVADLTSAGLHQDEAQAMVATWQSAWFGEPGVRVLYLLPQSWSDEHLPLRLNPAPQKVARVFVGRIDSLEPRSEARARFLLARNLQSTGPIDVAPWMNLGLGRFTPAALSIAARQLAAENGALKLNGAGADAFLSMNLLPSDHIHLNQQSRARRLQEIHLTLEQHLRSDAPSLAARVSP